MHTLPSLKHNLYLQFFFAEIYSFTHCFVRKHKTITEQTKGKKINDYGNF